MKEVFELKLNKLLKKFRGDLVIYDEIESFRDNNDP